MGQGYGQGWGERIRVSKVGDRVSAMAHIRGGGAIGRQLLLCAAVLSQPAAGSAVCESTVQR